MMHIKVEHEDAPDAVRALQVPVEGGGEECQVWRPADYGMDMLCSITSKLGLTYTQAWAQKACTHPCATAPAAASPGAT
eukprot:365680-Chlamydomonas_euryale.AAC.2